MTGQVSDEQGVQVAAFPTPPPVAGTIAMLAPIPVGQLAGCRTRPAVGSAAEVLYSDRSWRPVTVLAWARYEGSWAVLIGWPDGAEDWREYDHRYLRPVSGRDATAG